MRNTAAVLAIALVLCTPACAQQGEQRETGEKKKIAIGLGYTLFNPSSSRTADLYGDNWGRIGIGTLEIPAPDRWRLSLDLAVYSNDEANDVSLYAASAGVIKRIGKTGNAVPYAALRAGPYYGSVDAPSLSTNESKLGFNANASLGLIFNSRFVVEARYDYFSDIADTSFSGLRISVGVRLFDIGLRL